MTRLPSNVAMSRVRWLGQLVRIWWLRATTCLATAVGPVNDRGHYPAWFCDRWRWHSGAHRDRDHDATWTRDAR